MVVKDRARSEALCDLFRPYDIGGFVRMQAVYELIWCDFKDGVELVHVSNSTYKSHLPDKQPSPIEEISPEKWWWIVEATTWHHHSPEPRVRLFPSFYVTIYDYYSYPSIWDRSNPSISPVERTLADITPEEVTRFKNSVIEVVSRWTKDIHADTGVDWKGIAETFYDRTQRRLMAMKTVLQDYDKTQDPSHTMKVISQITFSILISHTDYHILNLTTQERIRRESIERANQLCNTAFTSHILRRVDLPWWERKLLNVLQTVISSVCDFTSLALKLSLLSQGEDRVQDIQRLTRELDQLMNYLRWPDWNRCDRQCDWDEVCFIFVWPINVMFPEADPAKPRTGCRKLEDVVIKDPLQ
jgi:hypothetical protein